ncbi:unnamed protein product [Soboliphyme baturini]|uniref:Cyclin-dependent kinase inhibitor domain-containing protein n=1 Tax=Soboliphyme baturini TaxID=241478 RepID=A0A183IDE4_9BILA|nr:unnamed protein product [Soboliphyme baturini]
MFRLWRISATFFTTVAAAAVVDYSRNDGSNGGKLVVQLAGRMVGWSVSRMVSWVGGRMVGRLPDDISSNIAQTPSQKSTLRQLCCLITSNSRPKKLAAHDWLILLRLSVVLVPPPPSLLPLLLLLLLPPLPLPLRSLLAATNSLLVGGHQSIFPLLAAPPHFVNTSLKSRIGRCRPREMSNKNSPRPSCCRSLRFDDSAAPDRASNVGVGQRSTLDDGLSRPLLNLGDLEKWFAKELAEKCLFYNFDFYNDRPLIIPIEYVNWIWEVLTEGPEFYFTFQSESHRS